MVKLLSAGFLGLLIWSQAMIGPELWRRPLSMFRDDDFGIVGYSLFAVLLVIGVLMFTAQRRARHWGGVVVFGEALVLLLVVAATPSSHPVHEAAAALLLFSLFGYYAGLLLLTNKLCLYLHLLMPVALACFAGWDYGPWQKGLIVYLLFVLNVHWHLLPAGALEDMASRQRRRIPALKRRIVYSIEPGETWGRRKQLSGSSCG